MSYDPTQPRDHGRFGFKPNHAPETGLAGSFTEGQKVTHVGRPGYVVLDASDETVTLAGPGGVHVMARHDDVAPCTGVDPYTELVTATAQVINMVTSVRKLDAGTRKALNEPSDERENAALYEAMGAVNRSWHNGGPEAYLMSLRATENAPLAANHAALAIAVRRHLRAEAFDTLTARVRGAGVTIG